MAPRHGAASLAHSPTRRLPPKPPAPAAAAVKLPLLGPRAEGEAAQQLWAASQLVLEANAARLPYLQPPAASTARRPNDMEIRRHLHPAAANMSLRQRRGSTNFGASSSSSSRSVNFMDRKSCQQAALDRDRQYVQQMFAQTMEQAKPCETAEPVEDHWWAATFAPVPNARDYLPRAFRARPPVRIDASLPPQSDLSGNSDPPLALEFEETQAILSVCKLFQSLVAQRSPDAGTPVLNRSSFCRMVCALDGLSTGEGKRTWLNRAVEHFDRLAGKIHVRGYSSGTITGFALSQGRQSAELFNVPIYRLFSHLLLDMANDLGAASPRTLQENGGGNAASKARYRLFQVLIPKAEAYARARADALRRFSDGTCSPRSQLKDVDERRRSSVSEQQPRQPRLQGAASGASKESGPPPLGSRRSYSSSSSLAGDSDGDELLSDCQGGDDESAATALYAHTFAVLKGELLTTQLLEPEVVHFTAEFGDLFKHLFDVYRDVPVSASEGHMTLKAFLRFCSDFGLFPQIVDFQTLQWLYSMAEGCRYHTIQRRVLQRSKSDDHKHQGRRRGKAASIAKDDGILFSGKWLKSHLAWLTKEMASMAEDELAAASILWAMDDWLESQRLQLHEFFAFLDGSLKAVTAEDLCVGIDFMALEDPPPHADVRRLAQLLQPQQPGPEREGPDVELETLQMAIMAIGRQKEKLNKSMNCFMKDFSKMTKAESTASIVFKEIWQLLDSRRMTPEQLFSAMDRGKGAVSRATFVQKVHDLFSLHPTSPVRSIKDPSLLLELNSEGEVTSEEFCKTMMKARQAQEFRELHDKEKHPCILSASAAKPPSPKTQRRVFGHQAFMECLMKVALVHLGYHGTAGQAAQPSFVKVLWLLVYLNWKFSSAMERMPPQALSSSIFGRRLAGGVAKYSSPMRRLLLDHPQLFSEAPKHGPSAQVLPSWAMRKQECSSCGPCDPGSWGNPICSSCSQADGILAASLGKGSPEAHGPGSFDSVLFAVATYC